MSRGAIWDLSKDELSTLVKTCKTQKEIMEKIGNGNHMALRERLNELDEKELVAFETKDRELAKYKKIPIEEVAVIVRDSKSMTDIWVKLGYSHRHGSNDKSFIEYLSLNNIDISHLDLPSLRTEKPTTFNAKSSKLRDIQLNFIEQQHILQYISTANSNTTFNFCVETLTKVNNLLDHSKQLFIELQNYLQSNAILHTTVPTHPDEIPLEDILIVDSKYLSTPLKKRLLKDNLIENRCAVCGMDPIWHGIPFELDLDHINGIHTDNRIENLRLLCQICHKLTPTYGSKNLVFQRLIKGTNTLKKSHCGDCNIELDTKNKYCEDCVVNHIGKSERQVERPPYDDLIEDVISTNYRDTGKKYGVSDKAIRKWIIAYGHTCPGAKELNRLRNLRKLKVKIGDKKIQLKSQLSSIANSNTQIPIDSDT